MTTRPCKKCLLADLDQSAVYKDIKRLIDILPENEKTGEEEYEKRLSACRQCEDLSEGTCQVCGCYVELRAASRDSHCPGRIKAW